MRAIIASAFVGLLCASQVQAGFTFSSTSGAAVTRTDLQADFDSLQPGVVHDYSEGGLELSVLNSRNSGFGEFNDAQYPGYNFGNGGSGDFLRLVAANDGEFSAIEFSLTAAFLGTTAQGFFYEVVLNGVVQEFGFSGLTGGPIAAFSYTQGFDELRVAAAYSQGTTGASLSISDVKGQYLFAPFQPSCPSSTAPVPEPMSLSLVGSGIGLMLLRARTRRRTSKAC